MNGLLRKILAIGMVAFYCAASGIMLLKVNTCVLAAAGTLYVDDDNVDGPWDGTILHPYQNITSGLEHASYGDTVHVLSGTYTENVVVDKSVTLKGDSKPVIDGMGGIGVSVIVSGDFAYGVTVDGFNITNSIWGIVFTMEYIEDLYNTSTVVGNVVLANNTISSAIEGIQIYVSDVGSNMYGNATLTIGDFHIADNVIKSDQGIDFVDFGYVGYEMHNSSSFSMGNIEIINNNVTSSGDGIRIEDISNLGCYMYDESSFTMGNIIVGSNTIDSGYYGILLDYLEYLGNYMEDNSKFTMGNIEFSHNTIHSAYEGIYIYEFYELGYYMHNNSRFAMGNILLNDNNISSGTTGIWFGWGEIGYLGTYMYGNSSFSMGNVEFSGNTINSSYDGMYIDAFYEYGYDMHNSSTFTMGSILVNDNIINSGEDGIYVYEFEYFGEDLYDTSSFTMGNIEFLRNIINGTSYGIHIYDFTVFGDSLNHDSAFKMNDILVNSNTINSDGYGIYIDYIEYFGGGGLYNTSSFAMGNIEFNENRIASGDDGICIREISRFGNHMSDNSVFSMGSILVNDNNISSGSYGVLFYNMRNFGRELYGNSSMSMNNVEFCRNTINSTADALGFSSFIDFGTYMYGNSSFSMGNVLVNDNRLQSYIWLTGFGSFGSALYEDSSCTMGNVEFGGNTIYSDVADGITFYSLQPFGYEMYNNSLFTMGDFSVFSNVVSSNGSRSGITCFEWPGGFGTVVHDNAVAATGSFRFDSNNVSFGWIGLNLHTVKNLTIRENTVLNCTYGIYLTESSGNSIYHNRFINNTFQATTTPNYNNTWDNGYPSGGNYWSEYTDVDANQGPNQNLPGNDGIWDNPYNIDENNTDRYPFAYSYYDGDPPTMEIPSRTPNADVLPNQEVTVAIDVTDFPSGVQNVTLFYTIDDGAHWTSIEMDINPSTGFYEGIIPGQEYGTTVRFKIEAFDHAGNNATRDGTEPYCIYTIVPEFPILAILPLFLMAMLPAIILHKRKHL